MSKDWQQKYSELTEFIAEHPEVSIRRNKVLIPKSVRHDFYNLFDNIRLALLRDEYPLLLINLKHFR
jgi:hypothetical protein